jgi:hypothetical protein
VVCALALVAGLVWIVVPSSALAAGQPVVGLAFDPVQVTVGATTQLRITVANPADGAAGPEQLEAFLPWGLDVATGTSAACGGTLTTTAAQPRAPRPFPSPPSAGAFIQWQAATVAPGAACQFSVLVIAAGADDYTVTAAPSYAGRISATTSLSVLPIARSPLVAAAFSPATVLLGHNSSLTLTITNPNATALTGLWFYYQQTPPYYQGAYGPVPERVTANTCGGNTDAADHNGVVLPPSMGLGDGSIPAFGHCQVTFAMSEFAPGVTRLPLLVHSAQGGSGGATAEIARVEPAPVVSLRIAPARIKVGARGSLRITINNHDDTALSGLAFIDALPSGLKIARPARASNTCGGTLIRRARPGIVGLLNGTVQAAEQYPGQSMRCVITVGVRATAPGSFTDTTGRVTAANALAARPATGRVTVRRT